ncbi:unnamed protein product, partial [Didymodactylos carnosus]
MLVHSAVAVKKPE